MTERKIFTLAVENDIGIVTFDVVGDAMNSFRGNRTTSLPAPTSK